METFSALLAICAGKSPVTGEFPAQRPVTWSFDVFFDLCQNKHLSKQWRGWWFETPSSPSWCLCNVMIGNHLRCWYQHETHNNWHLRLYGWITQYYVYSISLLITNSPRIFGTRDNSVQFSMTSTLFIQQRVRNILRSKRCIPVYMSIQLALFLLTVSLSATDHW